jgi:subtilisin family serine protease
MTKNSIRFAHFVVIAALWLAAGSVDSYVPASTPSLPNKVSSWVWDGTADGARTDLLVVLADQADLSSAAALTTKRERGRWVYETLWETAERSQAPLRTWLDVRGVPYRSFYIVNMIHVLDGDQTLVSALAARPDVARIEANPSVQNLEPDLYSDRVTAVLQNIEWNILQINADDVWAMGYTGQGLVVGGQDTGYDWLHPALKEQYRGWDGSGASHDYNWHDAIHSGGGVCGANSPEPCDDWGHGTHTMGTAVGDDGGSNQIGVAPGATWIGCRNMDRGLGSPTTYLECFEFFLAPYPVGADPGQGDPDLAPDVTNNSWSCPDSEGCSWETLQAAVEAQRAAGIMTVVSAGNEGYDGEYYVCGSVANPPAIYDASYTVGSVTSSGLLSSFSSRGPVNVDESGRLKPDIVAPGSGVRSSWPGTGYSSMSGTSMAAPHVAGAVALLWSAVPSLAHDMAATEAYLNSNTLQIPSSACSSSGVPNNLYGWGQLDIHAAVQAALAHHFYLPIVVQNYRF